MNDINKNEVAKKKIKDSLEKNDNPELIFGIVGPIGVNLELISACIQREMKTVNYNSEEIHLMNRLPLEFRGDVSDKSYYEKYKSLISCGNKFRENAGNPAALAGFAINEIRKIRKNATESVETPALGTAYIIRQFKRTEEIELMRTVYGRKFVQVSVFGTPDERKKLLVKNINSFNDSPKSNADSEAEAISLIQTDHNEVDVENGQRLSDVFHLGDVFVNGIDKTAAEKTISRFIAAFFGDNSDSPTKDEYGLYIASAASYRSVDLSRQVGCAIFSKNGEIISLGCNEVPKYGGGTYWTDDTTSASRDIEMGSDPNQNQKNEILYDLLERLSKAGLLSTDSSLDTDQKRIAHVLQQTDIGQAQIQDIIEFGRIIHAEMSAITDAARIGRGTSDATLFCTTFPCHICAKHIIAAGISRVVFLEPYPKSSTEKLHSDSITFEPTDNNKVLFQAFIGISPRRYRDIFEKKKRKDKSGKAMRWYYEKPVPMIEDRTNNYLDNEEGAFILTLSKIIEILG